LLWIIAGTVLTLAIASLGPVGAALRTGAGTAAHNLCSSMFVSDLSERQTEDELVGLLLGPAKRLLRVKADAPGRSVDAWLLFVHARAVFTPGYGCRLLLGPDAIAFAALPSEPPAPADEGFPKDGFFASGNLGQRIYIIPPENLVIARFGYSPAPSFGMRADLELIAAAITALQVR
jgi:CubicO group peptidase (beta-lactamase class C family)